MTKNDLITMVTSTLSEMEPVLQKCGVTVNHYKQEFDARTIPQLKEGLVWLQERIAVVKGYTDIRKLLSEEIWARYAHMDTEDFREVKLLNSAIARIKQSFVGRPALFRRKKDACKCKRRIPIEE